jgi:hypothetical protein
MYVSLSSVYPVALPSLLTAGLTDLIDKQTKEIRQDEDETVYKSLDELADDLPDHSPRFVLLSYPLTLVSPSQQPRPPVHTCGEWKLI